ncbi:hypothetical protein C8R46DRAFT_1152437 [Mycena filopes]|nr:hypothetical protein C8R46DRAFT_1152437 [Mycena filopes]
MVLLFLFTIPTFLLLWRWSRRPPPSALQKFHTKAWGRQWPRRYNSVSRDEIGRLGKDDELYLEPGIIVDNLPYSCLDNITEIAKLLRIPARIEDVTRFGNLLSGLVFIRIRSLPGKTAFLVYLLLHRMERRMPTAVQVTKDAFYIFDELGATKYPGETQSSDPNGPEAVSQNAGPSMTTVTALSTIPASGHLVFEYIQQFYGTMLVTKLPTVMEVASVITSEKWGPSIRPIIRMLRNPATVHGHAREVMAAAQLLAAAPSASILQTSLGKIPADGSSNLLFLDRFSNPPDPQSIVLIPTRHLAECFGQYAKMLTNDRAFSNA